MSSTTLRRDDLIPQSPDGNGKGLMLALLVHALLIAAISVSVNWRSSTPAGIEAELWAAVPQIAAPRPTAPEPAPTPAPPQAKPPAPPPRAEPAPQAVADAQIAIEKAKREEAKRKEEALRREELQKREEAKRKEEALRREEGQRLKEEQDRKKKELAEQKRKEAAQATAEAEQREKQLQRIAGLAGATGEPNSTGTAQRTAGPSAGYAGRIKARIMPNITFPDSVEGNPLATVEVRAAPDGTIIGRRLLKSSGVKAWDDAVLRAIDKTEVLPRDTDGRVPASFEIAFRVRE